MPSKSVRFSCSVSACLDRKVIQTLQANGQDTDFAYDTGAEVSTVAVETSKKLCLKLTDSDCHLKGADGSSLNVLGYSNVCIESAYNIVNAPVYIQEHSPYYVNICA